MEGEEVIMKTKKIILSILLCLALLLTTIAIPVGSYVADEQTDLVVYDASIDIKAQRQTMDAPIKTDYVFAGWYKGDETTGYVALTKSEADIADTAVAKFIHKNVLDVRCQLTKNLDSSSTETDLRMLTSVDSLQYGKVGFQIGLKGKTATVESNKVYTTVHGYTEEDGVTAYTPSKAFGCELSQYFMSFKITEIGKETFEETFTITPFWLTKDGTKVEGQVKTFKISEQVKDVEVSLQKTADTVLGTPLTLALESDAQIPAGDVTWTSSNTSVATVTNGVVTPVAKGQVTITAEYKGKTTSCDVTVYTKYIASETDFKTIYDDLSGYYKVTTDITLNSDHAKARNGATFTGLLDFGGHTFTVKTKAGSGALYSFRLFFKVDGGTIRNGHIAASAGYGNWGGAIADNAYNAVMENITADVILNATYACRDGSTQDQKRNVGGLYNLVNGGTFKSCVVNVTIPANITVTSGYALTDMSAIGKLNGTAPILTNCSATLVNNYNEDGINLLLGHANNVIVKEAVVGMPATADTVLGTPLTLTLESDTAIPEDEIIWTSSKPAVATVANGVVTPVTKGVTTITAEYKGKKVSCDVTIYTAYIASDAQFQTIYNDLSGYYKVTANVTLTTSHSTARNGATFTGLLDFGGNTITINTKTGSGTPYGFRMFFKVDGGTIRNGHLVSVAGYGNWGGVIADNAANAVTENITADIILNGTHAARQLNDTGTKRNAGGLYNLINGGTVKGCTVNVTIPSTTTVTSGYPITDMSAIGKVNGTAPTMTECTATLVNDYNDDAIHLMSGHANDVSVAE